MLSAAAQIIVLTLGVCVVLLSAWGIVNPGNLMKLVSSVLDKKWGIHFGIIFRLVLGAALIIAAPSSMFPAFFQALGWITVFAALALAIMGRKRIRRIIAWFNQLSTPVVRLWLLFGVAFGGLLVYGNL